MLLRGCDKDRLNDILNFEVDGGGVGTCWVEDAGLGEGEEG